MSLSQCSTHDVIVINYIDYDVIGALEGGMQDGWYFVFCTYILLLKLLFGAHYQTKI